MAPWFDPQITVDPIVASLLIWLTVDHVNMKAKLAAIERDVKYLRQRIDHMVTKDELAEKTI